MPLPPILTRLVMTHVHSDWLSNISPLNPAITYLSYLQYEAWGPGAR